MDLFEYRDTILHYFFNPNDDHLILGHLQNYGCEKKTNCCYTKTRWMIKKYCNTCYLIIYNQTSFFDDEDDIHKALMSFS